MSWDRTRMWFPDPCALDCDLTQTPISHPGSLPRPFLLPSYQDRGCTYFLLKAGHLESAGRGRQIHLSSSDFLLLDAPIILVSSRSLSQCFLLLFLWEIWLRPWYLNWTSGLLGSIFGESVFEFTLLSLPPLPPLSPWWTAQVPCEDVLLFNFKEDEYDAENSNIKLQVLWQAAHVDKHRRKCN